MIYLRSFTLPGPRRVRARPRGGPSIRSARESFKSWGGIPKRTMRPCAHACAHSSSFVLQSGGAPSTHDASLKFIHEDHATVSTMAARLLNKPKLHLILPGIASLGLVTFWSTGLVHFWVGWLVVRFFSGLLWSLFFGWRLL